MDQPNNAVKVPGSQVHLDLKSFTGEVLQLGRVFVRVLEGSVIKTKGNRVFSLCQSITFKIIQDKH